jgi:hypothetical protein
MTEREQLDALLLYINKRDDERWLKNKVTTEEGWE